MRKHNNGQAVVEACIVIPLFLFFMLFVIYLYRMIYVDAHIHQSLCEAAVYSAKRCYLEDRLLPDGKTGSDDTDKTNALDGVKAAQEPEQSVMNADALSPAELGVSTGIIYAQFNKYMGKDPIVKQVVAGGQKGIVITVTPDKKDRKVFVVKASYMTKLDVPVFGSFVFPRSNEVKQKAFLGYSSEEAVPDDETYVYITPNESVYHVSRGCSHLTRSVRKITGHAGYEACSFCGKEGDGNGVYVTDNGEAYHCNPECLGLKRTVKRVKKKDVSGLSVCSRCGR